MALIDLKGDNCVGCGLCLSLCTKGAIAFKEEKDGFIYPTIDATLCIHCHLCGKNCIAKRNVEEASQKSNIMYAARAKSWEIRKQSSSGGIFYLLAHKVLEQGGVVFGASINENGEVHHISVETPERLHTILGSKYVQSSFSDVFDQVFKILKTDRLVLVCGTPCQIAAVREKFGYHPQLILVDFLCHGVGSPKVFQAHLKHVLRGHPAKKISFRSKHISWRAYGVELVSEKRRYFRHHRRDNYMMLYLQNLILRKSCYDCQFQDSRADIRLGDFWEAERSTLIQDVGDGVSKVYIYTERGEALMRKINGDAELYLVDHPAEPCKRYVSVCQDQRNAFFEDMQRMPFQTLARKYTIQPSMKIRVYRWLKYRWKEVSYK